jgi:hypothetical protein
LVIHIRQSISVSGYTPSGFGEESGSFSHLID